MSACSNFRRDHPALWLEAQAERAIEDSLGNDLTLTLDDVADLWKASIAFEVMRQHAAQYKDDEFTAWAIRWLAVE